MLGWSYYQRTNVIRTIYLPNENAESLRLIIESLRNQLAEQVSLLIRQGGVFVHHIITMFRHIKYNNILL